MKRSLAAVFASIACASACAPPTSSTTTKEQTGANALLRDSLLNAVQKKCVPLVSVTTPYATDVGEPPSITPCSITNASAKAVVWQSDLDVDCDGGQQNVCRSDPAYQGDTSATTAGGDPLDANTVRFVVVPLPRPGGMDYEAERIALGNAAYVIYNGQILAGVFGDEGPADIIGEASFAMAKALGIDPDPVTGGADSGATFIVFTGSDAQVQPIEDGDEAERVAKIEAERVIAP